MTGAAKKLLDDLLALPEEDRAELAAELLASLDGPPDADWDESWLAETDRRVEAAKSPGETGSDWTDARARVLASLRAR